MPSLKIIIVILSVAFLSGCAPYLYQSRPMLEAYYNGNFEEAADLAGGVRTRKADKLLMYLDKGTVYHTAKNFKKSNKFFLKAAEIADDHKRNAAYLQMGAVFANDNVMPYIASPYERLMIHIYLMMNYAELGDFEDALVEVRRINTILPDIYSDGETRGYMKSSLNAYLSGLIWEANRLCNDAYIDYKRVQNLMRKPASLQEDLRRTSICAGLSGSVAEKAPHAPNIIIVLESGRSPVKESTEYDLPLQVIPVPFFQSRRTSINGATVKIDGKNMGSTENLEDVDSSLKGALDDDMPAIVARAAARLAVKEAAAVAIGEKVDKGLGVMVGTMVLATNRADLRSWKTLPESIGIWKGHLPPGKHTILLEFLGGSGKKRISNPQVIDLKGGKSVLLVYRTVK